MPKAPKTIEISRTYFETIRNDNRRLHFSYNRILSELKRICNQFEFIKKENTRLREENARLVNENGAIAASLDATMGGILFSIKNKK